MHRFIAPITVVWLALLAASAFAKAPEWVGKDRPELTARVLRGKGNWKPAGVRRRPLQRWSLDVTRGDNGEVTGSVTVSDSPLLANGRVRGKIAGEQVSGTVVRPDGAEVLRFWGTVKDRKVRGTYSDSTGETGEWVWDGLLPE